MAKATYQEIEDEFDLVTGVYVKKFKADPPEYLPIEFEWAIVEMEKALKTGIPLEQLPEDAVT